MLNLKETDKQKVFFTSDWHLNHKQEFVWKSRGYTSIQDHNNSILQITNEIVKENDILFNLGDFTLNCSIEDFELFISRIRCQNVYMLWGNHPNKHYKEIYIPCIKSYLGALYNDGMELYPIRYKNIIYISHYAEIIVNGQYIILSHYPLYSWNHMKGGSFHLHGHEHSAVDNHLPEGSNGKILDLSWDYFKHPLSFSEINDIMKTKNIISIGHH